MPYSVAVAGSTHNSLILAQSLQSSGNFSLELIITPQPKPSGRKQLPVENPLLSWAKIKNLKTILIDNKIEKKYFDDNLYSRPDFLLVVDFGYILAEWLTAWPKVAAVNVHPSALPRWRGSAPAQMVLLHGEPVSAVSLIQIIAKLDSGPIVSQYPFTVGTNWTQTEYYQHSFELMAQKLPDDLELLAQGKITPKPQPSDSPTPLARKIQKSDAFVAWFEVQQAMVGGQNAIKLERAVRAYHPWPSLWTNLPTKKGESRLKILSVHLDKQQQLVLDQVQIEGQQPALWNQVKNNLRD